MASQTTNYHLKKPAYTDTADIADINDNMDTIDGVLADKLDKANVYNGLDKSAAGYALDARQGKALNDGKLDKANVYNDLDETAAGFALDARQGKGLNDKIDGQVQTRKVLNDPDALSTSVAPGLYYAMNASNVPTGSKYGYLDVTDAGNNLRIVRWQAYSSYDVYVNMQQASSTWSGWKKQAPGVIDNLTSTSTTDALSAAQGKVLNDEKISKNTAGGIATVGGNGQYWYVLVCTIKITSAYINRPIVLEISGRHVRFSTLQILFNGQNTTDPTLAYFTTDFENCFYIRKTTTSTWEVYARYTEVWGFYALHRVTGAGADIGVTVNMTNYSTVDAVPSGATQVSYGGNVNYANSAGAVAWGNVTGKPNRAGSDTDGGKANSAAVLIGMDARNINYVPSSYWATGTIGRVGTEFKGRTTIGAPGSSMYGMLTTFTPWSDGSGGRPVQLYTDSGSRIFAVRYATSDTAWSGFKNLDNTVHVEWGTSMTVNDCTHALVMFGHRYKCVVWLPSDAGIDISVDYYDTSGIHGFYKETTSNSIQFSSTASGTAITITRSGRSFTIKSTDETTNRTWTAFCY